MISRVNVQAGAPSAGSDNGVDGLCGGQPVGQDNRSWGDKGFDAGKKIKGRKRHIVVDVFGLVLAIIITAASVQDRDGGASALRLAKASHPTLDLVWADTAYNGFFWGGGSGKSSVDVAGAHRAFIRSSIVGWWKGRSDA